MKVYKELGLIKYKGDIYRASRVDVSDTNIEWNIWLTPINDWPILVIAEEKPTELEYILYS